MSKTILNMIAVDMLSSQLTGLVYQDYSAQVAQMDATRLEAYLTQIYQGNEIPGFIFQSSLVMAILIKYLNRGCMRHTIMNFLVNITMEECIATFFLGQNNDLRHHIAVAIQSDDELLQQPAMKILSNLELSVDNYDFDYTILNFKSFRARQLNEVFTTLITQNASKSPQLVLQNVKLIISIIREQKNGLNNIAAAFLSVITNGYINQEIFDWSLQMRARDLLAEAIKFDLSEFINIKNATGFIGLLQLQNDDLHDIFFEILAVLDRNTIKTLMSARMGIVMFYSYQQTKDVRIEHFVRENIVEFEIELEMIRRILGI